MGQTIILDNDPLIPYKVTGVMANVPKNSHLDVNFLLPIEDSNMSWTNQNYFTYVLVDPNTPVTVNNLTNRDLVRTFSVKTNSTVDVDSYGLGLGLNTKIFNGFDVGLNYEVGKKWPLKAMPIKKWKKLSHKLENKNIKVSWQEGLNSIYDYIEWIN